MAVGDLIAARCALGPVLLVIEDLHWADPVLVELASTLLRRLEDAPLFVIATAREHDASLAAAHRVELRGLSKRAARALVAAVLGDGPSDRADAILERAEGNPLFAEELALAVREGSSELPLSIEATLQSRLDALPREERDLLRRASVLGPRFAIEALVALGEPSPARLLPRLRHRELIAPEARGQEATEWAFRQPLVREHSYRSLTDEQRARLHVLAGGWLASKPDAAPAEIARHYDAGGDPVRAAPYWRAAAERAQRTDDVKLVADAAARAIPHEADEAARVRLHRMRAEALFHQVRYDEMREELARLEAFGTREARVTVHVQRAVLHLRRAEYAEATRECDAGLSIDPTHVRLVSLRAFTRAESGRPGEAVPVAEEALALARGSGDPKLVAAALRCVAFCVAMTGDHARSLPLRRQTLAAYEAIGNGRFASQQRTDIGADLLVLGDAAQAASSLEKALEQARALGIRYTEGYALHNLGLARARLGAVDAGLAAEDEATLIAQQIGERRLAFACDSYRCVILLEAGRASEALRAIERGLAEPEEVHGHIAPCMRALRAAALVACGRRDEAAQEARRALAMREAAGGMEEHEADLFLAAHDAGVDGALEQGARALFARASAVSDAELRASFLGRVPSHARLVLLAREAGLWPG